jgi:hypothetical protein
MIGFEFTVFWCELLWQVVFLPSKDQRTCKIADRTASVKYHERYLVFPFSWEKS